jgi:hypothetical protein
VGSRSPLKPTYPQEKETKMAKATVADDLLEYTEFEFQGEVYKTKRKFKMFKFFKTISENPVEAVALALEEESLARLEEKELDMDDFKDLLELISNAIAGTDSGN